MRGSWGLVVAVLLEEGACAGGGGAVYVEDDGGDAGAGGREDGAESGFRGDVGVDTVAGEHAFYDKCLIERGVGGYLYHNCFSFSIVNGRSRR